MIKQGSAVIAPGAVVMMLVWFVPRQLCVRCSGFVCTSQAFEYDFKVWNSEPNVRFFQHKLYTDMIYIYTHMGVSQKGGCPKCPKKRHPWRPLGSPGFYWRGTLLRQPDFWDIPIYIYVYEFIYLFIYYLFMNSLMEHDRFLHTTKREECNVSLHACGDFEQHWRWECQMETEL